MCVSWLLRVKAFEFSSFEEEGTSESSEASLLSVLRAPTPSELARKRKVSSNPPRGAKGVLQTTQRVYHHLIV